MDEKNSFLMEKLRAKGGGLKSLKEYSKALRTTLQEKRYSLEVTEKNYLQECLDLLQQNILVSTLPAIVERLEVISRHLGLKFVPSPKGLEWFISSDMFYVEVLLEPNGVIKDVKIHHDGAGDRSCEEMRTSLEKRDFGDFTLQLEGLISIYNLNADQKIKSKAFMSLQCLEADISQLFETQCFYLTDSFDIIHKSDVGLVQKRRGGHPMKIVYFVSPYDLLDVAEKAYKPLTLNVLDVKYNVAVCLESSSTNKLQTQPLVRVIKSEKKDETCDSWFHNAVFDELSASNANLLPACFVMKFNERMPLCESVIEKVQTITHIDINKNEKPVHILNLIKNEILQTNCHCMDDSNIVILPDQRHCYIMSNNNDMQAYLVQSIPFSHPAHISKILPLLRQQALFNSLISSCIRPPQTKNEKKKVVTQKNSSEYDSVNGFGLQLFSFDNFTDSQVPSMKLDIPETFMFEVMPLSLEQITVIFEHPVDETLMTADLDLTDVSNLRCTLSTASDDANVSIFNAENCAAQALQRSFSLPATMRVLIHLWESHPDTSDEEDINEYTTNNEVSESNVAAIKAMDVCGTAEISKDNSVSMEFNPVATIKLESLEHSPSGFPSFNRPNEFVLNQRFNLSPSSIGPTTPMDLEVTSATAPSSSTFSCESGPSPFLDNTSEHPNSPFVVKPEPINESAKDAFFRKVSADPLDPTELIGDSSSDSELNESTREVLADCKHLSPSSTCSSFSALAEKSPHIQAAEKCIQVFDSDHSVIDNLEEMQEFLKMTESKIPKNESGNTLTSSVLPDHVLPSISLTAVTLPSSIPASITVTHQGSSSSHESEQQPPSLQQQQSQRCRPQIPSFPSLNLPTSLSIIPVTMEEVEERNKDRKKFRSSADDKLSQKSEKNRKKRKREDSPMGPPEKIRSKDFSLTKNVSVSLKPIDTQIPRSPSPNSGSLAYQKYSVSPTNPTGLGKISPSSHSTNNNLVKKAVNSPNISGNTKMISPKHSLSSSPKSSSSSSGGSKASISVYKSAIITSPSTSSSGGGSGGKMNSEFKKSHRDSSSSRESKEKKSSSSNGSMSRHQSPKPKSAPLKGKVEAAIGDRSSSSGNSALMSTHGDSSGCGLSDPKSSSAPPSKNKKEQNLASVIDKLSAKQLEDKCNNGNGGSGSSSCGSGGKSNSPTLKEMKNSNLSTQVTLTVDINKNNANPGKSGSNEYTIKQQSSDGNNLRMTFKTRKEQVLSKLCSGKDSGSPKHGNLSSSSKSSLSSLPGLGLSKKPSTTSPKLPVSSSSPGPLSSKHSSKPGSSSSSSSSLKGKSNHSPKSGYSSDPSRNKDKCRPLKLGSHSSEKPLSIFSSTPKRSSPASQNEDVLPTFAPKLNMNFQIPKISDRNKTMLAVGEGNKKASDSCAALLASSDTDNSTSLSKEIMQALIPKSDPPSLLKSVSTEESKRSESPKPNSFELRKLTTQAEIGTDTISSSSHQQISSSCTISPGVQSSDSIKVNL